jgi:hypothetical protein
MTDADNDGDEDEDVYNKGKVVPVHITKTYRWNGGTVIQH